MSALARIIPTTATEISRSELAARLFDLSIDAKRAGYGIAAEHLLYLASDVLKPSTQEPIAR